MARPFEDWRLRFDDQAPGPRLFVEAPLAPGASVAAAPEQAHYLRVVLRLADGAALVAFDGRSGEYAARLVADGKRGATLEIGERLRPQPAAFDLAYLFAPLKHARLDYMAQKATEMGATMLAPVVTRRTQATRINLARLRANAIEAAEQCGGLVVPRIAPERALDAAMAELEDDRLLIFCDEDAAGAAPLDALRERGPSRVAVLVGPEGGFDPAERAALLRRPNAVRLSLGPRILRADTAAVAALALVQATLGDARTAIAAPR